MKIAAEQKIVSEVDHVCGYFWNWIDDGAEIKPDDLYLEADEIREPAIVCEECQAVIAKMNMGRWEVRSEWGWIA